VPWVAKKVADCIITLITQIRWKRPK